MPSKRQYFGLAVVVVCLLALAIAISSGIANRSKPAFLTPPNPNGFELLTVAASSIRGVGPWRGGSPRAYVEENTESLRLMREAIRHPAELPEKYYKSKNSPVADVMAILRLGELAKLQAVQFQNEGNWDAAASSYLDLVRLGHRVQRGIMVCVLTGMKIEKLGLEGLDAVGPHLPADKRQSLATELAGLSATAITLNEFRERELYWFHKNVLLGTVVAPLLPRFKEGMLAIQPRLARSRQNLEETRLKLQTP